MYGVFKLKKELDNGNYLLVKYKPYGNSNKTVKLIIKLTDTYITSINCLTGQPKWWNTKVIYAEEDGIYKVGDVPCICMCYMDDLDYEVITEEEALAMAL